MELYSTLNQLKDSIVFGTPSGFFVYSVNPFKKILAREIPGGIKLVRILNRSNIFIFVGLSQESPYPSNKVIVWDESKQKIMGDIKFRDMILNVDLSMDFIVVATAINVFVYELNTLNLIGMIGTAINPQGVFSLSYGAPVLLTLGESVGQIALWRIVRQANAYELQPICSVTAHKNPIARLALGEAGNIIATASERGTIIRIYEVRDDIIELLKELRRGADPSRILTMSFSPNRENLILGSDKGTVHVFSTGVGSRPNTRMNGYGIGLIKNYLPAYFDSEWSYSQFYIKETDIYLGFINDRQIVCIGGTGNYYEMELNDNRLSVIKTIQFYSDQNDPFSNRTNTIK